MAIITGGSSVANTANVDTDNQLLVATNVDATKAGAVRSFSEVDAGDVTGTALCMSPESSTDYRLRVGVDRIIDQEVFCYANQNTGKFGYTASTLTFAQTGGFLVSNGSSIVTANTAARFFTHRMFASNAQQTPIYIEFNSVFTASLSGSTNTTIDFGLFLDSGASPYAPSDGVYFRATSAGIQGVINFNGVETTTSVFLVAPGGATFFPTIGQVYQFLLQVTNREVRFWIDDVLYGTLITQSGNAQPYMAGALPVKIRHAIASGGAAGNTQNFKTAGLSVYWGDVERDKSWGQVCTGAGGSMQVQQGATTGGQLSVYALGAAPATVTLTASTAPATNNLGGLYALPVAVAVGESDYPMFAWLKKAGTVAIPGKVFVCTGVVIGEQWVSIAALTGGPLVTAWAIGWGSTAASLATTESTTFASGTTKIARKMPLGNQTLAAAAALGTVALGFQRVFPDGIPINPGEYLHIIARFHGVALTAGTAQVRGSVGITGYFE